jgi:hypothetical protein
MIWASRATIEACNPSTWPSRARSAGAAAPEEWFVDGAADGFNLLPPYFPGAFADFVDLIVPELQRRGLFRNE